MSGNINDQKAVRIGKVRLLRQLGIDPYPPFFSKTHSSVELQNERQSLESSNTEISYAGRVVRYNRKGKICFVHLKDAWDKIQTVISLSEIGEATYEVVKLIDIGDWVGAKGKMFTTKSGEYSIRATSFYLLSKAIRPIPVPKGKQTQDGKTIVYDAFRDKEKRYRQRYLDLVLNDEVRDVFRKRSVIISSIRSYLGESGYVEVETPILQPLYGGAYARPFTTHHNALNMDLYLRISNELYLKRSIIGGFEKVFEFAKDFRNEGIDRTHYPEFTLLEFYEAYADYNTMMGRVENIFEHATLAVHGSTMFEYQSNEIDISIPWQRIPFKKAIKMYASIEVDLLDNAELIQVIKDNDLKMEPNATRGKMLIILFEGLVSPQLIQPHIVFDFPRESSPLCRIHRENTELIEQFEVYIGGLELCNAYSEMVDPLLQRESLELQVKTGNGIGTDTHPIDEDFLFALESGMPPTGGVGIGIDRMVMVLTDSANIRDVLLFPIMKPT